MVPISLMGAGSAPAADIVWFGSLPGNYSDTTKWDSGTVPGNGDTAVFVLAGDITIDSDHEVGAWRVQGGGPPIVFDSSANFDFFGAGIVDGSRVVLRNTGGILSFRGNSAIDGATIENSAQTIFWGSSSAGTARIENSGTLHFFNNSSGGNAFIENTGFVEFAEMNSAENANIDNAGTLIFSFTASAGNSTISNRDTLHFEGFTTAGTATITTEAGGTTSFWEGGTGGSARFITQAGGLFDLSNLVEAGITAGSIEGAGDYNLHDRELTVGLNNLSTTVSGEISGVGGKLTKVGTGTLTLSGANTYTGATTVEEGALVVNGSLVSAVTVNNGAAFGGSGTIGGLTINNGTLAPGNSIGTMTINGDVTLSAGSVYEVEVDDTGASDRTNVTGSATLAGTVRVLAAPGNYLPNRTYTILNAAGGLNGTTFDSVSANFAFLTPSLAYDLNNVYLTLVQSAGLTSAARTPNQRAAATGVQSLGPSDPLFGSVLSLPTDEAARAAFDALSGEVHASTAGVLTTDAGYVRNAVLSRLRQAPYEGSTAMASLATGGPETQGTGVLAYAAAPAIAPAAERQWTFWTQAVGAWADFGGDGNAAGVDRRLGGGLVGADTRVGEDAWLGLAAGFSHSKISASDRASSADVDSAHVALYGGTRFGAWNVRAGAAYAYHQIETDRTIAFPGFFERATADYDGGTGQIFGEIGYGFALGHVAVEPFAGLAWVHTRTDAFTETGGTAALNGAGTSEQTGYATLGARFAAAFALDNGMTFVPRFAAAWQHAFDDVSPTASLAFLGAGLPFTIAGTPIASNSALVEAGFDLRIAPDVALGIAYAGQFASSTDDHAVKGKFVWTF